MEEDQLNLRRARTSRVSEKRPSLFKMLSKKALLGLSILIIAVLWLLLSYIASLNTWKAVFLDNGQTYFGKFINIPFSQNLTLRNAYYLKPTPDSPDQTLVSVTRDIHGPKPTLVISKKHILYFEYLRSDSPLVSAIALEEEKKK